MARQLNERPALVGSRGVFALGINSDANPNDGPCAIAHAILPGAATGFLLYGLQIVPMTLGGLAPA